ncbi:hypothetical protein [Nostocoides jenkinsii]|nr:hypothetical protein [Tetrasphaera jenkinsii]
MDSPSDITPRYQSAATGNRPGRTAYGMLGEWTPEEAEDSGVWRSEASCSSPGSRT